MLNSGFSLRRPPSGVTFHRLMEKEPSHVLYATSARNRGIGLDSVAHETLRGTKDQLGLAIAYANRARDLDPAKILTLQWHPVRLFSSLERKYYYGAKKKVLDRVASRYFLQGLPSSVKILGFTNRVEELYRQCSVFVFPSECEGSAKSTYEAAASGLAQIVTRESGDVVIDGLNGFVIPPKNDEAIEDAILRLYRNPDLALKMGAAGRERAVGQFTWDHFRRRVLEAYRAAMAIRQPQLV